MSEHNVRLEELLPLIQERLEAGQSVRFSPRGTSMLPMLRQGKDIVVLSPLPKRLKKFDLPLYRRADGQFVIHRITKVGETYTCMGDNQFWPEHGLKYTQMIALVTAFTRNGTEHSVNEPGYRFYCWFWHYSRPVRRLWRYGIGLIRRMLG